MRCLTPWQLAEIPGGRKCGQWIVGIGIGLHFTPVVMEQVLSHFGLIFFGALITSLSAVVGVWLMRRTGEDRATAFFSSMPGGSGEMVNLGARNGAVLSRVAAGAEFAGVGGGALRSGSVQIPAGGRRTDFPRWRHRLALAGAIVSGGSARGLDLGTPAATQPLAVRAIAGPVSYTHLTLPTNREV